MSALSCQLNIALHCFALLRIMSLCFALRCFALHCVSSLCFVLPLVPAPRMMPQESLRRMPLMRMNVKKLFLLFELASLRVFSGSGELCLSLCLHLNEFERSRRYSGPSAAVTGDLVSIKNCGTWVSWSFALRPKSSTVKSRKFLCPL